MADAGLARTAGSTRLVLLVSVALLINYVDRGNLATALPLIHAELGLSGTQLGWLLSIFYYSYVASMVPAGWASERYGAHRVLAAGMAIWSLATLLTGFTTGFWSILLLRLLLGVGESAAFPCSSQLFASRLNLHQLGFANGVLGTGYLVGSAVGTLLGGLLMPVYGWRAVFIAFGAVSLLYAWPLARIRPQQPARAIPADVDSAAPSLRLILRQRGLWGASLGLFASNYNFYFILSWLPEYLVKERGFSLNGMAAVASSAYLINAVSALLAGGIVSAWTRTGRSPNIFYKSIMATAHIVSMVTMFGMTVLSLGGCIACLCLFEIVVGLSSPGVYAIAQTIAGPSATGRWVGVQNGIGNLAGVVSPLLTGILLDVTGHFASAFLLAGVLNILGLVGWVWLLPRIQPLDWARAGLAARAGARDLNRDSTSLRV
ncbi:MAG TPA: MFS transporter [Steroidobacteraceae bacterium]|nr:MFS transporter [Steroidobacteraceae bacterium]